MKILVSIAMLLVLPNISTARDLAEANNVICEKVKTCGTAQLETQGLPPEMVTMMKAMFDGMCETMVEPYVTKAFDAGLEQKAIACLDSISAMSCEDLMQGEGNESEECKELERAADEAGLTE